jgi:hypothetical protein
MQQALNQRNKSTWNWMPTDSNQTNCTTAAMSVLASGKINTIAFFTLPPFTPNDFGCNQNW